MRLRGRAGHHPCCNASRFCGYLLSGRLADMDEPVWDEEAAGPPDWVFDAAREPDGDGEGAGLDERPGIAEIRKRHRKAYDRWSPRADAELAAAYLAGRSIEQLAASFERQPSAIRRRLERLAFAAMTRARAAPPDAESR
jgi:DNA-directed RNA polymerase specialized sigma24 family protein